jgi:hypothetical protein
VADLFLCCPVDAARDLQSIPTINRMSALRVSDRRRARAALAAASTDAEIAAPATPAPAKRKSLAEPVAEAATTTTCTPRVKVYLHRAWQGRCRSYGAVQPRPGCKGCPRSLVDWTTLLSSPPRNVGSSVGTLL